MKPSDPQLIEQAKACMQLEIDAVEATADALDQHFCDAIRQIIATFKNGRKLIFTGVGKNVAIAQKLVGTFNSIGGPSCFLDPCQAQHGDLGLCAAGDLAFFLSNSGETEELLALLPILKRFDVATVLITGNSKSQLARYTDNTLVYSVPREACPLNLAPTASTTAALALGDALAMVYLQAHPFSANDFARYHPGGNLGKSLLLKVEDIMRTGDRFAHLPQTCTVQEAILAITQARSGLIALTDESTGQLSGVFTDGDLRRHILEEPDFLATPVANYMTTQATKVHHQALAAEALKLFEQKQINDLIVIDDDDKPIGIIDGQDLAKLHIV